MARSIRKLPLNEIKLYLDKDSKKRIAKAEGEIKDALRIEKRFRSLFGTKYNWWEACEKICKENNFNISLTFIFYMLIDDIRKNGIKEPLRIEVRIDELWTLQNGCHRFAIANILGIDEIEVELYRNCL